MKAVFTCLFSTGQLTRTLILLLFLSLLSVNANAQLTCATLDGSVVYSQEVDPVYLGFFGSPFATDSIMNEFSQYGSPFGTYSVRNEFGLYGSPFGTYSANNDFTSTPPKIFKNDLFIAYLTTNTFKIPGVSLEEIDESCTFSSVVPSFGGLPAPPALVDASDGTYTDKIAISWTSVAAATSYNVYYSSSVGGDQTLLGNYVGTSVNATGTAPGDVWYFWVYSVNANGESATGTYDSGYVQSLPEKTAPEAPTLISVEPGNGQAVMNFSENGDGGSPIIDFTASCNSISQTGTVSPITVGGLINDTEYSCSVVATNEVGDSAPSNSVLVTPTSSPSFEMNAGLNDAWYYPVTDGQGFFITVFPDLGFVTLAWFTYDTVRPGAGVSANLGEPGHRWLTALGEYSGNQSVMDITIASGGLFDTSTEIARDADGTIILTFTDCNSGTIEYDIPSIGEAGLVPIQRVANDNIALCEMLNVE